MCGGCRSREHSTTSTSCDCNAAGCKATPENQAMVGKRKMARRRRNNDKPSEGVGCWSTSACTNEFNLHGFHSHEQAAVDGAHSCCSRSPCSPIGGSSSALPAVTSYNTPIEDITVGALDEMVGMPSTISRALTGVARSCGERCCFGGDLPAPSTG